MPPHKPQGSYTNKTTGETTEVKPVVKRPAAPEMPQGYTHIRNGIFEHTAMQNGMSPYEFCVYLTLLRFADFKTGVCLTNADSISAHWSEITPEAVRQCLNRLRKKNYIAYPLSKGKRGSYPVLIDKYEPGGDLLGWRLNAAATFNINDPLYEWVSPTPMHEVYSAEQLTYLKDSMVDIWDWVADIVAKAPVGKKQDVFNSYSGQKQVGSSLYSGQNQVVLNLEAGRSQVRIRPEALYTASLLHGITESRKHGSIPSLPTAGGGVPCLPSEEPEEPVIIFDENRHSCDKCQLPAPECRCEFDCVEDTCSFRSTGIDAYVAHLAAEHRLRLRRQTDEEGFLCWAPCPIPFDREDDDDDLV